MRTYENYQITKRMFKFWTIFIFDTSIYVCVRFRSGANLTPAVNRQLVFVSPFVSSSLLEVFPSSFFMSSLSSCGSVFLFAFHFVFFGFSPYLFPLPFLLCFLLSIRLPSSTVVVPDSVLVIAFLFLFVCVVRFGTVLYRPLARHRHECTWFCLCRAGPERATRFSRDAPRRQ